MVIKAKADVILPQTAQAYHIAANVGFAYEAHSCIDCTITSGLDGKHKKGSKHYIGHALDFRIWPIKTRTILLEIVDTIRYRLGNEYDVVLEKDHIHVEYDPKRKIKVAYNVK